MVTRAIRLVETINHNPEEPNVRSSDPDQGLLTGSCELLN
jgi:hypothetical protein